MSFVLWLGISIASAESAQTLPAHSQVVYAGLGLNTYEQLQFTDGTGSEDQTLDRGLRTRLDLYGAMGLHERLTLSAILPVVHSTVLDDDDRGPCPDGQPFDDFCTAFTTLGPSALGLRFRATSSPLVLTAGISAGGDPWNSGVVGRYTSISDAALGLRPELLAERAFELSGGYGLGLLTAGAYRYVFGSDAPDGTAGSFTTPADEFQWQGELHVKTPHKVRIEVGAKGMHRLWGLDWDEAYQVGYFPTDDRWRVLWYRQVEATAKLSLELPADMGLHLGMSRVVQVRNGPPDTVDITLGVHRFFSGRNQD